MRTATIIVLALSGTFRFANAQQQINSMAEAGRQEIFIYLGKGIVSTAKPFQNITGYRVERKEATKNPWAPVGEYTAPSTLEEFKKRFSEALAFFPQPHQDAPVPLDRIWQMVSRANISDSIAPYNFYLPVMIALGYAAVDNTSRKNIQYQYRISHRVSGQWQPAFVTNTVALPSKTVIPTPGLVRVFPQSNVIEITYGMKGKNLPSYYRVLRRDDFKGGFNPIPLQKIVRLKSDSLFLVLYDTSVVQRKAYEYVVLTYDRSGNSGPSSDTVTTASYNFNEVGLPYRIKVRQRQNISGLALSWRMDKPQLCRGLRLYRSLDHNKGYVSIADLPPTDTMFVDQDVIPMKRYYYHFRVLGILGESSVTSATVFGLFQSSFLPMPPVRLRAATDAQGIKLSWQPGDTHVKGYYIYRAIEGRPLELVSRLVADTLYLDKSQGLSGKIFYDYSLKAENTSHEISNFSDTVRARPGLPTKPQQPRELISKKSNGGIRLSWLEMREFDNTISSYEIERAQDSKTFSPVSFSEENNFYDSLVVKGNNYVYRVRAIDIYRGQSEWSAETSILLSGSSGLFPPPAFHAFKGSNIVTLRWGGSLQAGSSGYKIYRQTGTAPATLLTMVSSQTYEYTDKSIRTGERYTYYITTTGASAESERSPAIVLRFSPD